MKVCLKYCLHFIAQIPCRWSCSACQLQARYHPSPLQLSKTSQRHPIFTRRQVGNLGVPRTNFLSPNHPPSYIAATHDTHVQVWRTPNHLIREFAPFVLHRTYTGHHEEVISIQWSQDSRSPISPLDKSNLSLTCPLLGSLSALPET